MIDDWLPPVPDVNLAMVKWALSFKPTRVKHPPAAPPVKPNLVTGGLKEQLIAGKVYVEFTSAEVYAGGDRVSVLFNGGAGQGFLDVTDSEVRVLLEEGGKVSTLSVIPIGEICMIQLVYKGVAEDPNVCIRTAEFVVTTQRSPQRLFRFKLKELDYRSVVVEKICQVSKQEFPVMHVESTTIDHIFQSRIYDYNSDEETLPEGGSETESSSNEDPAPS